jgi:hypothetical protein
MWGVVYLNEENDGGVFGFCVLMMIAADMFALSAPWA